MSASLVGSEMCIRDSSTSLRGHRSHSLLSDSRSPLELPGCMTQPLKSVFGLAARPRTREDCFRARRKTKPYRLLWNCAWNSGGFRSPRTAPRHT
eukprot:4257125-Alexandrium_andersonii.AAC.1